MQENPFILEPFKSVEYFCDRERETREIINNISNGRNTTLISPRRLGKTGLIFRVFEEIRLLELQYETIYADISDTQNLDEFIKALSDAVVSKLKKQQGISDFFNALKSVRPLIGLDPITGSPQISFTFSNESQKQDTLIEVLTYLENHPQKIVLAIDEFQQIREYEGVNMEAVLRKNIQHLHNVRFIFCGSKKHTMTDMFTNAKKPFYESIYQNFQLMFMGISSGRNFLYPIKTLTKNQSTIYWNGHRRTPITLNGSVMRYSQVQGEW